MTIIKKALLFLLVALLATSSKAIQVTDSLWNREFACAQDIIDTYSDVKKVRDNNGKEQQILNICYYVWQSGEYMFKCRGKNEDIAMLPQFHMVRL